MKENKKMKVIVTYQETEQNEENQPMMVTRRKEIETDEFDFIEATDILTGNKRDEHGNSIQGIRIGDKNYFRAIDIININVE